MELNSTTSVPLQAEDIVGLNTFKQSGSFSWIGKGYKTMEEAETDILEMIQRVPAFLFDDKRDYTAYVQKDTKTGIISAQLYTSVSDVDQDW